MKVGKQLRESARGLSVLIAELGGEETTPYSGAQGGFLLPAQTHPSSSGFPRSRRVQEVKGSKGGEGAGARRGSLEPSGARSTRRLAGGPVTLTALETCGAWGRCPADVARVRRRRSPACDRGTGVAGRVTGWVR